MNERWQTLIEAGADVKDIRIESLPQFDHHYRLAILVADQLSSAAQSPTSEPTRRRCCGSDYWIIKH